MQSHIQRCAFPGICRTGNEQHPLVAMDEIHKTMPVSVRKAQLFDRFEPLLGIQDPDDHTLPLDRGHH